MKKTCFLFLTIIVILGIFNGEKEVKANSVEHPILIEANKYVGVPYVYGGEDPKGFDSSGFVQYVLKQSYNITMPRTVKKQYEVEIGTSVDRDSLEPGDLVFFGNGADDVSHVSIYNGNDELIHATVSQGVSITSLEKSTYWSSRYVGAKRISNEIDNIIVKEALKYEGSPYLYGGVTPEGFDSSGFVQYVINQTLDFMLPRTARSQYVMGEEVSRDSLQPGDLIFFGSDADITHVAIYKGNDQLIHATVSQGVSITSFEGSAYWSNKFVGAKRINGSPIIDANHPIIKEALKYIGTPYLFGGENPEEGFDCSAFVRYVYLHSLKIYLPRSTDQQWQVGEIVSKENIQPGDVIFFSDTYREGISHNGIYIGDNQFIHATRGDQVTISYINSEYWEEKFTGIRRFTGLTLPKENPIVAEATKFIGEIPYVKGGTTPEEGFDVSGFVQYVFKEAANVDIPRYGEQQWQIGENVARNDIQPGDLVFFKLSTINSAIYIGNDQVVHVTLSDGVRVTNIRTNSYWSNAYIGAKRVEGLPAQ
ncbi:C40 family peptidase [Bacillus sp. FJAT-50079]|uniref:C40 family peptidase n=1 Tax=Bacillus sp. FJAT-50079 TaxID=2833577 RepID=UPI001BC98271|nr:C40 family peptidase [Bacillus sp. FJAT-50079]MBS4206724.1 C40 family peptidase [Bacillus sp. FJAT-50079]